jgi:hypothetical protein
MARRTGEQTKASMAKKLIWRNSRLANRTRNSVVAAI